MDKNLETYNNKDVVNWYLQLSEILPVEQLFFEKRADSLKQARILDIGIGGGRTTNYLQQKSKYYTGIDYSENFVKALKQRFPQSDIQCIDARNLSPFSDNSFDLVNFSFNGLDYMDLDGRRRCLSEIKRILKPGATFFFSTHNKDHRSFGKAAWLSKQNSSFVNLKTFLKLLPFLIRNLKNKTYEIITSEYAIINDSAHSYRLMTFYTSLVFLKNQLREAGFEDVVLYKRDGKIVDDNESAEDWIFIECRKV